MKNRRWILLLWFAALLAGCATGRVVYDHPDATQDEFRKDLAYCHEFAKVVTRTGLPIKRGEDSYTRSWAYLMGRYDPSIHRYVAADFQTLETQCMFDRGYRAHREPG